MSAVFVAGDMFRAINLRAMGHGCNCAGAMGKGIAVEFRDRFPAMYAEYKRRCLDGSFALGDVFSWVEGERVVFNLGTQKSWKSKAQLSAIERSVRQMLTEAEAMKIEWVGVPRLGAGLGGLSWQPVRALLEAIAAEHRPRLIVFEDFVAGLVVDTAKLASSNATR